METWIFIVKTKANERTDIKPASWDQKKDLKGPICLAKTPPRKSYIPHPNIPIIPDNMLKMVVLMSGMNSLCVSIDLLMMKY
jgi:hypothetical protein